MKNQAGFTLIEVIVTLILVGIVALMGGMAIVQVTQGYIFTKDNAELTQKAQLATSRITKEIVEMTGISADATASTLPLKNNIRNVTIGLNNGSIKIAPEGTGLGSGDILVNNVHAFTLTYYSKDNAG
ncbi:MAG: prepilin-type N-terminal cleavage/methylation domain-containing protein, partial [Smithellaceae bacterium]|nr:prepilin-type N-terminal cleavage/methylation domain-containing protein [Smithellaceae bacterium]